MKRFKRLLILMMTCVFMLQAVPVYATESTESEGTVVSSEEDRQIGYIYLKATYTDNITPMKGDTFEIKYSVYGNEDEYQTITVDAYDIYKEPKLIGLPEGQTYVIKSIGRTSENGGLTSYCIQQMFNVDSDPQYYETMTLTIGIDDVQQRYNTTQQLVAMGVITDKMIADNPDKTMDDLMQEYRDMETDRVKIETWEDSQKEEGSSENTTEAASEVTTASEDVYEEDFGDDYGVEIQEGATDEPSIEVYSTESTQEDEASESASNESESNSSMAKIIILLAVIALAIVVAGVAFMKGRTTRR